MNFKVGLAFFIVSTTSLLPYNLFMNAHKYFDYKLRNVTVEYNSTSLLGEESQTSYQRSLEGLLMVFGGVACIVGATLNLLLTDRLTNSFRVIVGHIIVIFVFIPTIIFTYLNTDEYQALFYYTSLTLAACASFGSLGLIGGGILGLASMYPEPYMQLVMFGQAFAGIAAALLSMACQAFTSSALANGRVYFFIAVVCTIISTCSYIYLSRRSHVTPMQDRIAVDGFEDLEDQNPLFADDDSDDMDSKKKYKVVIAQTSTDLMSIVVLLVVTLSAFPAVASLVKSTTNHETWQSYFTSICCFLTFNVGDACGRFLGSRVKLASRMLLSLSFVRSLFIPLILMCNIDPRFHSNTVLHFDGFFILLMFCFGMSHGTLFTVAIGNVARLADRNLKEVSGSIVNLTTVISAMTGSIIGVRLVAVI